MIKMMCMKDLFMDAEAIIFSSMGSADVALSPAWLGSRWEFAMDDGKRLGKAGASLSQFLSFSFHHRKTLDNNDLNQVGVQRF